MRILAATPACLPIGPAVNQACRSVSCVDSWFGSHGSWQFEALSSRTFELQVGLLVIDKAFDIWIPIQWPR